MPEPTQIGPATSTWLMPAAAAAGTPDVVDQADDVVDQKIGTWQRWTLTEPVRLYLYVCLLVLTAGLQLAGYLTGEWREFIAMNSAVLLAVGGTGEAIRASVYSPAGTIRAARAAAAAVTR